MQADVPAWAPEGREGQSQEAIADQGRPWQVKAFWNPRCYQHLRCHYSFPWGCSLYCLVSVFVFVVVFVSVFVSVLFGWMAHTGEVGESYFRVMKRNCLTKQRQIDGGWPEQVGFHLSRIRFKSLEVLNQDLCDCVQLRSGATYAYLVLVGRLHWKVHWLTSDLAKCQYRTRPKEMKLEVAKMAKYSTRAKECEIGLPAPRITVCVCPLVLVWNFYPI